MEEPTKTPKKTKVTKATVEEIRAAELAEIGGKKLSLGKFSSIIMPVVLALAISYFMVTAIATPKSIYNNAVTGLNNRMAVIETSIDEIVTGQDAMITSIQGLGVEIAGYAVDTVTQGQLDSLAGELDSLEAQVAELNIPAQGELITIIDNKFSEYDDEFNKLEIEIAGIETSLESIIGNIESALSELQITVASIGTDIFNLDGNTESALTDLQAAITAIEQDIEALNEENEEEESEPIVADDTTLWTKEVYSTSNINIDYTISPTRLEEEGDYILMVYLYNHDLSVNNDVVLDIIFSPRTGDRVKVDESEIYLDSTRTPFYAWFGEVVKRTDDTCRRMVFTSEKIRIDAGEEIILLDETTMVDPGRLTLRLEFTLGYK